MSSIDGRRAALSNEQLTFICVISGNTLVWRSTLDAVGFIGFIRSVDSEGASYSLPSVGFVAVLTSKGNSAMNSTLQFNASGALNGTAVQCTNGAFTPEESKTLFIAVNPGAPFNVSVSIYTLSSITLAWNPPLFDGLDDILGYKVAVSRLGGVFVANVSSANTSVVIPSLQYNTPYTFEVKAVNRVGASPGTVYSFVILPEDPPIPFNLSAHELCGNFGVSLVLTWQLPFLSHLVPRPVSLVVNVTQAGLTTVTQLQPNASSYIINNAIIRQTLDITLYIKSPTLNGKGTNIEISINDHITSTNVTVGDTSARVTCTSCYGSTSALLLSYYMCDSANDTPSLKAAIGGGAGGVYRVDVPSLSPNTTYCYAAVLYDPATSQPIGPPAVGMFVTNASLHPASRDARAMPSSSPAASNRSILEEGTGVSTTLIVAAISTTFFGLTILLLTAFVTFRCYLKRRKTQLSIKLQKSEPPRYFDPLDRVEGVQTIDNVAYCTVATANALVRAKADC
eukprot:Em0005g601a